MKESDEFTEKGSKIYDDALRTYHFRSISEAIDLLSNYIKEDAIPEEERRFFSEMRNTWLLSCDSDYMPAIKSSQREAYPLSLRCRQEYRKGNVSGALSLAWIYLSHCTIGTVSFFVALADVIDLAALSNNMQSARYAAEVYLLNYKLMSTISKEIFVDPTVFAELGEDEFVINNSQFELAIPVTAAMRGIVEDPAPCWATLLKLHAERIPVSDQNRPHYSKVLELLQTYNRSLGVLPGLDLF